MVATTMNIDHEVRLSENVLYQIFLFFQQNVQKVMHFARLI